MAEWWASLDLMLKILYCITLPASAILVLQTLLLLFGLGHNGAGVDTSDVSGLTDHGGIDVSGHFNGDLHDGGADIGVDHDVDHGTVDSGSPGELPTLHLFTLQTVIAFLTVFGWTSIVSLQSGAKAWVAMSIGALLGFVGMVLIAELVRLSSRLAENGTQDLRNALGLAATVYLPIPASGGGRGKVTLNLQGSFTECDAVQFGDTDLAVGTPVQVIDVRNDVLVVEKEF